MQTSQKGIFNASALLSLEFIFELWEIVEGGFRCVGCVGRVSIFKCVRTEAIYFNFLRGEACAL